MNNNKRNMDNHKYTEASKKLIDLYFNKKDYKMGFIMLLKFIENYNSNNIHDEALEQFILYYKSRLI
tara:strand:+ start:389 stop:589 length:201 start_codon:yes stop_codon:yes gene_type:complete